MEESFIIKDPKNKEHKFTKTNFSINSQQKEKINLEQTEGIKKNILNSLNNNNTFYIIKDNNNVNYYLSENQLNEIINHNQKVPFINYEVYTLQNQKIHTTKKNCSDAISNPSNEKYVLCYDNSTPSDIFYSSINKIKNFDKDPDDDFEISNNKKIKFKNLKIKVVDSFKKLGVQPEEEKMILIKDLIKKLNSNNLDEYHQSKDINNNDCYINNDYIPKLKNISQGDDNETNYKIIEINNKNIIVNKKEVDLSKNGNLIKLKNKQNGNYLLVNKNILINNLNNFISTDNSILVENKLNNSNEEINPLNLEILPKYNGELPLEKIIKEKEKAALVNDEEKDVNASKSKKPTRLRAIPPVHPKPDKVYTIRRAIIYRIKKNE